jgi:NADH-quinone oxidoreductase subunit F
MTTQVLFQNRRPDRIATLEEYRAGGGYEALATVLGKYSRSEVQQLALDAVLLGRGGCGFSSREKVDDSGRNRAISPLHGLQRR